MLPLHLVTLSLVHLRVAWARQSGFCAFLFYLDRIKVLQKKKEEGSVRLLGLSSGIRVLGPYHFLW